MGPREGPASFGSFAGDLLVGNFGNGMINAYDPTTGAFEGALDGSDGSPLVIDGLWALTIGNGSAAGGSLNTLFFTAGPNGESDGLFGSLAVPDLRPGRCCCWASAPSASPPIAGRRRRLASLAPDWRPIFKDRREAAFLLAGITACQNLEPRTIDGLAKNVRYTSSASANKGHSPTGSQTGKTTQCGDWPSRFLYAQHLLILADRRSEVDERSKPHCSGFRRRPLKRATLRLQP